jgi:transposase InsO family protein
MTGRCEAADSVMLTVVDEFTRENHLIHVDRRIRSCDVCRQLERHIRIHGVPKQIRGDNKSECIRRELQLWLKEQGMKTLYIEPGSLWQNAFIESFHARFQEKCLGREELWTLSEARVFIKNWRHQYNKIRPHRSLNLETPKTFARAAACQAAASGWVTPSLRPPLDVTPLIERYFNPPPNRSRLTLPVGHFG